jgi:hypothetical protein
MVDGSGNIQVIAEFPPPFLKSDNIVYYKQKAYVQTSNEKEL